MELSSTNELLDSEKLSFDRFRDEVLNDYRLACESREVSLLGRKEVLTGKAKFGIFGDGKEVAQVAAAKFFKPGDFLSGYYRDQTFAFATGVATVEEFFSQLYADPDPANDPHSAGRQMNSHFASPLVGENGEWLDLANRKNITSGMAPTAAQMPRSIGLALASKLFREEKLLQPFTSLSTNGNEVCFCTIGDASTSEGHFWETVNAAGVMQVPVAFFVWDDGYGISVPKKFQTTKGSISLFSRISTCATKAIEKESRRIYPLIALIWRISKLSALFNFTPSEGNPVNTGSLADNLSESGNRTAALSI